MHSTVKCDPVSKVTGSCGRLGVPTLIPTQLVLRSRTLTENMPQQRLPRQFTLVLPDGILETWLRCADNISGNEHTATLHHHNTAALMRYLQARPLELHVSHI